MRLTAIKLTLDGYRGPFRLWVVCAALWIAGAFALPWYLDHAHSTADEVLAGIGTRADCETRARSDRRVNVKTCYERLDQRATWQRTGRLLWAFVPPILLLPIGAGVIWIIRGFRRDRGGKPARSAGTVAISAPAAPAAQTSGPANAGAASAGARSPVVIQRRSVAGPGS
jgi:hypothetical protein